VGGWQKEMRHRVKGRKLSRNSAQRKALFKSLINSLVLHGEIKTTQTKALAIRGLTDKLITKGKKQTLHARRLILSFLQNKKAVNKIVDELAPLFKDKKSGFTRITKIGNRRGDDALMVKIELTKKPEKKVEKKEDKKGTKEEVKTSKETAKK